MNAKHTPTRMCMVCRTRHPKEELLRVVKIDNNIFFDKTHKAEGRGAYLCKNHECHEKFLKSRALNRTFKQDVPQEVYTDILRQIAIDENINRQNGEE